MEQLEQPEARQHHALDTLQIWKHVLPDTQSAMLPPHNAHPNPLVIGDAVVASVFSPGAVCALDKASGRLRWIHNLDALGGSCVTYADGKIYAKSTRTVYCLDAASGHEYWKFSPIATGRETVYSFPTFHRERVYLGDRAGVFRCLDARSGDEIWAQQVSSGKNNQVNSTAVIYDDLVVVGSNDSLVAAYDTARGTGAWKQSTDGPCITEILSQDGKILATTTTSVYLLHPSTGEILFRKSWQGMDIHCVVVCPDSILVVIRPQRINSSEVRPTSSSAGRMIALRGATELYDVEAAEFIIGMRFHGETGLIYESRFEGLGIVDPSTGQRLHNIYLEDEPLGFGLVDIDAGHIYALDMGKNVYCLRSPLSSSSGRVAA